MEEELKKVSKKDANEKVKNVATTKKSTASKRTATVSKKNAHENDSIIVSTGVKKVATRKKSSEESAQKVSSPKNKKTVSSKTESADTQKEKKVAQKNVKNDGEKNTTKKSQGKTSENNIKKQDTANSKIVAKKKSTTEEKTKNTKASSSKTTSKATSVKKKITEEVVKPASEKSSKIKMKTKEKKNAESEQIVEKEPVINTKQIEKQNKLDLDAIDAEIQRKNSIPKSDYRSILKKSLLNVTHVVLFIIFLIFNIVGFYKIPGGTFIKQLHVLSFVFLAGSIVMFEIAYKKEDTQKCIIGIESLLMGILTLVFPYVYQIYHNNFLRIVASSMVVIIGYFMIKACFTFYRKQNTYLRLQENFVNEEEDNEFNIDDDDN